MKSATAIK